MEKNKFIKRNLLSFVVFFVIMIIIFYFLFPGNTLSEYIIGSTISTIIYHIPVLINFFKKNWMY